MKFSEIEAGKKYFNTKATWQKNRMTGRKTRDTVTVRVLQVNPEKKQILVSLNGFPAEWCGLGACKNWTRENPQP
jgi:hypothetical protein